MSSSQTLLETTIADVPYWIVLTAVDTTEQSTSTELAYSIFKEDGTEAPRVRATDVSELKDRTGLCDLPLEVLQTILSYAIASPLTPSCTPHNQRDYNANKTSRNLRRHFGPAQSPIPTITSLLATSKGTRDSMQWVVSQRRAAIEAWLQSCHFESRIDYNPEHRWWAFAEWRTLLRIESLAEPSSQPHTDAAGKITADAAVVKREDDMRHSLLRKERAAGAVETEMGAFTGSEMVDGQSHWQREGDAIACERAAEEHLREVRVMVEEW